MKIKSIIIGLLVLCCHNIMAQDLKMGFHVGGNLSGYTGGKQYTIYDKSGKVGYEVGADIQYLLKNKFSLASGINLLQTGGKFSVMSGYAGSTGGSQTEFPAVNTKSLSLEMAPHNVRVNCVCPGDVDTSLVDKQIANAQQDAEAAKAEMGQHYPLGRIGQPHEIGEVIVFLLSNKASFVTGAAWTIDGGLTSW